MKLTLQNIFTILFLLMFNISMLSIWLKVKMLTNRRKTVKSCLGAELCNAECSPSNIR